MFVVGLITLEINALQLLPVCLGEWEMYWEIIYGAFVIFFFFWVEEICYLTNKISHNSYKQTGLADESILLDLSEFWSS